MNSHRSTALRVSLLGVVAFLLAACTTTRPFPVDPAKSLVRALESEEPLVATGAAVSPPGPTIVAVCYNSLVDSDAEIVAEAQRSCPAGRLTERQDDQFWTRCPLLQPERANFICVPEERPSLSTPAQ